jgi:hypothetical protein
MRRLFVAKALTKRNSSSCPVNPYTEVTMATRYTTALIAAMALFIAACGEEQTPAPNAPGVPSEAPVVLSIVSGSENKALEPLVHSLGRSSGFRTRIRYMGSVDMTLMLAEKGTAMPFDAVWPANSLWLTLGDRQRVVKKPPASCAHRWYSA